MTEYLPLVSVVVIVVSTILNIKMHRTSIRLSQQVLTDVLALHRDLSEYQKNTISREEHYSAIKSLSRSLRAKGEAQSEAKPGKVTKTSLIQEG